MNFETILIECARENSNNFKFDPKNELSKNNSIWENNVNFQLKIGDQVSVENAVIHSIGNSGESTVEINGEENQNGYIDNQAGFEFLYYINNNGYNAVQLPYVAGYNDRHNMKVDNQPINNFSFDFAPFVNMSTYITVPTVNGVKTLPPQYGGPIINPEGYNFVFTHKNFIPIGDNEGGGKASLCMEDNIFTSYKQPLGLSNPNGEYTYDCSKYILLDLDFKGYYRSSNNNLGNENGEFEDEKDDLIAYSQKVNFTIDKGYTTPSTICNNINEALHETFENSDDEVKVLNQDGEPVTGVYQGKTYPFKLVNGNVESDNRSPCWSNIAVKDFNKCRGVYNMMRCSLIFDGLFRFDNSPTEYLNNRPSIHINGCVCRFKTYDNSIIETSMYPFKKIDYNVNGSIQQSAEAFDPPSADPINFTDKSARVIFSMLPEGWLITSNMKYTPENITRLRRYFEGMEKYTGNVNNKNDALNDIENWYVRMDLGMSRDGNNSNETRPFGLIDFQIDPYIGHVADMRNIGCGKIRIDGINGDILGFQAGAIYNGGTPVNPYSMNEILLGMNVEADDGENFRYLTCPRSTTPRFGQKMFDRSGELTISSTDLNFNFYNNEFEDCNLTLYSKFLPDFKSIMKQSNTTKAEADWEEGDGEVKHKINLDDIKTDLENEYGIYGVPVQKHNIDPLTYELCLDGNPVYFQGYIDSIQSLNGTTTRDEKNVAGSYKYLTKIQVSTGGDQFINGGYDFLKWNDDIAVKAFEKKDNVFIYTQGNQNIKAGQGVLNLTYRGGKTIDFETYTNQVVFYIDDDYSWVGEIETDIAPFTKIVIYPIDNMNFPTVAPSSDRVFYSYLYLDFQQKITISTEKVVNLYVQSTQPGVKSTAQALNPTLNINSGGAEEENDFYPFLATDNTELCCGFILKNSSYNLDENGDKTLTNNKHLLPSMYQSLFLCSPAFMDLPSIWCVNSMNTEFSTQYLTGGYAQKYMSIGASDPTCSFNSSLEKSTFSQFHTSRILGITEMPFTDASQNELDTDTLGNVVTKFYDNKYPYYNVLDYLNLTTTDLGDGDFRVNVNYLENDNYLNNPEYATSGIMIYKIYGTKNEDIENYPEEILTEDDFNNTLLYKIGFLRSDFFNDFGEQTSLYDSSIVGKYDKNNRYRNCNFITTNPIIDISVEPFLSVYSGGESASFSGLPLYQLSFLPLRTPHTIDAGTSESIIANNKPIKQNTAYYQIRTDLASVNYISNNENTKTIGIALKEYSSGDFLYCNIADYGITILQNQNISTIETQLRLSNGSLSATNQFNTVIYKIRRPIIIEDIQTIIENVEQEQKQYNKQIKKELKKN